MDAHWKGARHGMSSDLDSTSAAMPNPRGGRPKLPPHQRRSEKLECRFSVDELAQLRAAAARANLSMSEFIRVRTLRPTTMAPATSADKTAALSALNRAIMALGPLQDKLAPLNNNMNQIARYLHTGRDIQTGHWLEEERGDIAELREGLAKVLSQSESALKKVFEW
ncbi:MAG: hypothetical protein AAGL90_10070 [Pseudomonadota bacterium]